MSDHPLDEPDESPPPDESETNERFDKIRAQLKRSRERQFGLAGILFLMAVIAVILAWLRQAEGTYLGLVIPLVVLFGVAVSGTGLIMLLESVRLKLKEKARLAKTFLRFGIVFLITGIPGGIVFAVLAVYLASL